MLTSAPLVLGREPVRFNRDIRQIMSDTCFHCHGFDPKTREEGLRLDIRDAAISPTEEGTIGIVPGKPDESEIIARIFDEDDPMPPDKAHKPLTKEQKDLFRRWVEEGAVYESHWAYTPLQQPAPPAGSEGRSAIDAFIQSKLSEKKIAPSAEAPKAKLLRRLSLDLIGLPPTPAEVAEFVADESPQSYRKQVDRLLASPHYGERMAVWWLDIARFADTVGFHGDQNQRIFPYRDYVIDAFNQNKRFDQFTIEQLAGDLLPDPTPEQLIATGYNRLNMMTREGGAQNKEYLAKYGAERVRAVSATWLGSTMGCAECHDHKFDPIKTRDFYELQAFFADVQQWGVYTNFRYKPVGELVEFSENNAPFPPEIEVSNRLLETRHDGLREKLKAHFEAFHVRSGSDESLAAWTQNSAAFLEKHPTGWQAAPVSARLEKGGKPVPDGKVEISGSLTVQFRKPVLKDETLKLTLDSAAGRSISSIRLEAGAEWKVVSEPKIFDAARGLKMEAGVRSAGGKERPIGIHFADAAAKLARYANSNEIIGVHDGWRLPHDLPSSGLSAVWLLDAPVRLAEGETLVLTITGDTAVPLRIYTSPFGATEPMKVADEPLRSALITPDKERTQQQRQTISTAWLMSTGSDANALANARGLASNLRKTTGGKAWTMVTRAVPPQTVRVLPRGNWQDESGPVVLPATPSFLPGRVESSEQQRLSRLDLAKWIVSDTNPITARAVMNRLWQTFFGTGLSAVVDDLGSQGELPSHPELLDWLAAEFRRSGWDMKHMIGLIVTSDTYRQSSSLRPELRDSDPLNRLLASQNPRRLEAEFIRDNALFIAGQLKLDEIGGPSVKPYQPDDYYDALQFPGRDYHASYGSEQWRRGLYMHWQRTFLHPMLTNFDAPARDECAAFRTVSNTPQQALTLLNDPTFVEAARLLASRILKNPDTPKNEAKLREAYQLVLAREPKPEEISAQLAALQKLRDHYRSVPDEATKLLKTGSAPPPPGDPVENAAWTNLCRILLNAHETLTRY